PPPRIQPFISSLPSQGTSQTASTLVTRRLCSRRHQGLRDRIEIDSAKNSARMTPALQELEYHTKRKLFSPKRCVACDRPRVGAQSTFIPREDDACTHHHRTAGAILDTTCS